MDLIKKIFKGKKTVTLPPIDLILYSKTPNPIEKEIVEKIVERTKNVDEILLSTGKENNYELWVKTNNSSKDKNPTTNMKGYVIPGNYIPTGYFVVG